MSVYLPRDVAQEGDINIPLRNCLAHAVGRWLSLLLVQLGASRSPLLLPILILLLLLFHSLLNNNNQHMDSISINPNFLRGVY